jgi:ribose transport system ATP-binding protein
LRGVSFDLRAGRIHACSAENGAGQIHLIKTLAGIHTPERGEILIEGRVLTSLLPGTPPGWASASSHQELALAPNLSVAENSFSVAEPGRFGFLDKVAMRREGRWRGRRLRFHELNDVQAPGRYVAHGVAPARRDRARSFLRSRVLVLDEPTTSLTAARNTKRCFANSKVFRSQGVGIIYISHRIGGDPAPREPGHGFT